MMLCQPNCVGTKRQKSGTLGRRLSLGLWLLFLYLRLVWEVGRYSWLQVDSDVPFNDVRL